MINEGNHLLIIASLSSSIIALLLIFFKSKIIRLAGAAWNYYLWATIFIPWLTAWLPINFLAPNHVNLRIYSDKAILNKTLAGYNQHTFSMTNLLTYIWVTGICFFLLYIFIQHVYYSRKLQTSSRKLTALEKNALSKLLDFTEKKYVDKIYVSKIILSPMIAHLISPKIYIPTGFFDYYTSEEQKYVLRHELVHYLRFDLLANTVILVFNCINWFNPILFFSYQHFRNTQEIACDANITRHFSSAEKKSYGLALLKTTIKQRTLISVVSCLLNSGMQLKERFLMLKFHGTNKNIVIVIMVLFVAIFTSIIGPQLDKYLTKLIVPQIQFFTENKYSRNSVEDLFMGNVLLLPNNTEIWAANIVVTYADKARKIISKCSINTPGVILRNNKVIHFKYGELDLNTLQFMGAIQ